MRKEAALRAAGRAAIVPDTRVRAIHPGTPGSMRITNRRRAAAAILGLLLAAPAAAQVRPAPAPSPDSATLAGFRWRNIGPNRGGRSIAVAGSTRRPLEYWFGATGGGIWKTTDGGTTWRPMSDRAFSSSSVGAIGVCEANPDVVYAGMGEVQLRGNIMPGDGVYRSADGGKTWAHVGLRDAQMIGRVRVHPTDCDRAYVAALGHAFGSNQERGVFRTRDGGKTWQKTLFRSENAGAVDLILTPGRPDTLYASTWEVGRTPWALSSGGPGSGLFRSTDGGTTWTELTRNPGLPRGILGKIGVTVSAANPNRLWAIVEAAEGGVFRSDDAGATWTRINDERKLRQRAFYYSRIYADPRDTATVYVLNVAFWKSTDGGKTYKAIRTPHSDNHDLWIDPQNPQRMVQANDGGGNVSVNGGESWTEQDYPTAQMYHVVTTGHFPYHVCGAQQDNSTACVPSNGSGREWYAVGGGESGYIAPRPDQTDVFYAGSYGGLMTRFDRRTGQRRNIQIWPENPMGYSASDIRERFQWTFPIVLAPRNPNVLFAASQHLWRSTDEGESWTRISPDLTRGDPKTLGPSGGPITLDQTGVETYGTIFTVAPSPRDSMTIWAGSDDGVVSVTRDGGRSWQNVTPRGLPEFARISLIEASPHDPMRAYVAANRYQMDDPAPYAFRTDDGGRNWTQITRGIAAGHFVRAVREDPTRAGLLYAGTEHGPYVSWNQGAQWSSLRLGLPDVQVSDLVVHGNDLVAATHGRSFYVLDEISPLRQLTATSNRAAHLFRPDDVVRAADPGVSVFYSLPRNPRRVTLDFMDARGTVIRSFSGTPADTVRGAGGSGSPAGGEDEDEDSPRRRTDPKAPARAGMNRFVWDLRHPGATDFPGMILWAAGTNGPRVPPGRYRVRLTVDGRAVGAEEFNVRIDPRLTGVTQADLEAQSALALRVRDRTSDANRAVIRIRGIRQRIDQRLTRTQDPAIRSAADSLKARLSVIENALYQTRLQSNQDPLNYPIRLNNQMAALLGVIESAEARPTRPTMTVFEELSRRLDVQLGALDRLLATDLPRLNTLLRGRRLAPVPSNPPAPRAPAADAGRAGEEEEGEGEEGEER
ncbi:MAG TPA: hypothetical protein VF584_04570 [Longimicrobium sp.]